MKTLRRKEWRVYTVAIMLIATLSVVWHGAMSYVAHPIFEASQAITVAAAAHTDHMHDHTLGGHAADPGDHHATHDHGKSKSGNDCCSTVGAATLPALVASKFSVEPVSGLRPVAAVGGEGLEAATPAKPPRTTYPC
jgi:hypothetical protein